MTYENPVCSEQIQKKKVDPVLPRLSFEYKEIEWSIQDKL